jgi:hypothetical protein
LPRIKAEDSTFGATYSERPKLFGQYFRAAFRKFRNTIEGEAYWHPLLLENYRHKGNNIYRGVRQDIKAQQKTYKTILSSLGEKDSIIHISNDWGQLDILMALDSIDRKIYSFLEQVEARAVLRNQYLTHQYSKIKVFDTLTEVIAQKASVMIINSTSFAIHDIPKEKIDEISILILLKSAKIQSKFAVEDFGFVVHSEEHDVIFLGKKVT